jgi:hypothetical protein
MTDHDAPPALRPADPPGHPADRALLALADQLTAAGYHTSSPAWNGQAYLKITNARHALSEITIDPSGDVTWECRATHPGRTIPAQLTVVILALLDPAANPHAAAVEQRTDLAPFSLAGRALAARGLDVTLEVLDISQTDYTTYTELRITNPARPERGSASIADDGTTWWECTTRQRANSQPVLSLDSIADAITRALAATAPPG